MWKFVVLLACSQVLTGSAYAKDEKPKAAKAGSSSTCSAQPKKPAGSDPATNYFVCRADKPADAECKTIELCNQVGTGTYFNFNGKFPGCYSSSYTWKTYDQLKSKCDIVVFEGEPSHLYIGTDGTISGPDCSKGWCDCGKDGNSECPNPKPPVQPYPRSGNCCGCGRCDAEWRKRFQLPGKKRGLGEKVKRGGYEMVTWDSRLESPHELVRRKKPDHDHKKPDHDDFWRRDDPKKPDHDDFW